MFARKIQNPPWLFMLGIVYGTHQFWSIFFGPTLKHDNLKVTTIFVVLISVLQGDNGYLKITSQQKF